MTTPDLKICTWAKGKHGIPFASLPQVHKDKYGDHPDIEIKVKFAEPLRKFNLAVHPGGEPSDVDEPPSKKRRLFVNFQLGCTTKDENTKEGTPTKLSLEDEIAPTGNPTKEFNPSTVDLSTLGTLVMKAQIPAGKGTMAEIQVRDQAPFLVNASAPDGQAIKCASGMTICSWWKGQWFHNKPGPQAALTESDVLGL